MTRFGRVLLLIVVAAFGVRVAYVALAKAGPCPVVVDGKVAGSSPSECARGDQVFYNAAANALARGDGFVEPFWPVTHPGERPPPAADHPPATVVVLAAVSWLVDHPPLSWVIEEPLRDRAREHRYAMVVLGTAIVALVGLLGRRAGGDAVGLVAAAIAAVTPNLWVNDGLVMSETVTGLAVVGALLLALAMWERPSLARAGALGAVCGLAALARAELILFVPALAIVVAVAARGSRADRSAFAVAALAAAAIVLGPWVGYNLARFHDPVFLSTNDGIALAGSNCDPVYGGTGIGLTSFVPGCLSDPPPPGDQSEVARAYRDRAWRYVRAHEARAALVAVVRVGRTWSLFRPFDMVAFNQGEGREPWVTRLGLVAFYPTLAGALTGGVLLFRSRRCRALWVLAVPAITVTAGSALTYGQTRFRAAAEPSLAVLAAVGAVAGWSALTARRHRPGAPAGGSVTR